MSKGVKIIFLVLVGALIVSVFMGLSLLSQKTSLEKSKAAFDNTLTQYKDREQTLTQENKKLVDQLNEAQSAQSKLQKQWTDLNEKTGGLVGERDDWKGKVENLKRERDELIAKLQAKAQAIVSEPAAAGSSAEEQERYWADVLKDRAGLEVKLGELREKLSSGAIAVEELKKKNSDLELAVGQLQNDKEEIARQIKYNEDLINNLSIDLAREKNDKRYMNEKFEKLKEENIALRSQVRELTAVKVALEKSVAKVTAEKDTAEKKLLTMGNVIQDRISEVADIKQTLDKELKTISSTLRSKEIELPPIIVSATRDKTNNTTMANPIPPEDDSGPLSAGLTGKVVSINEENNFVVVDLGENAGVRIGDIFSIYHGSAYVTSVEVIQVRKDISAADIKQKGAKIQVGDTVR